MGRRVHRRFVNGLWRETEAPTLITDREWDHLIVLDACRHDLMEAVLGTPARSVVSPGSHTRGWLAASVGRNPDRDRLSDVVLVSANPFHSEEYFERRGWPFPYRDAFDLWRAPFWDEEWETVRPEVVTEVAREIASRGHRVLVHYMQPHFPPVTARLPGHAIRVPELGVTGRGRDGPNRYLWTLIRDGLVPFHRAVRLYEDNLRVVLRHVHSLNAILRGLVIVTSDHGNLFGEYGFYGHHEGLRVPELVRVPWLELSRGKDAGSYEKESRDYLPSPPK